MRSAISATVLAAALALAPAAWADCMHSAHDEHAGQTVADMENGTALTADELVGAGSDTLSGPALVLLELRQDPAISLGSAEGTAGQDTLLPSAGH